MWRPMVTFIVTAALIYLALCGLLYLYQRHLIYFPQPMSRSEGSATHTLVADGAEVRVSVRERVGPSAVLYFGGNAEDVSYSLPGLSAAFSECAIYSMHYRGYGGSSGSPSEAALVADALALFDKVRVDHQDITVVGRSLGSGVAVHLASARPVARLVLVTPYDSLQDIAARQFPYFPVRWLLQDKFESWRYAQRISAPTLIVAAENDEVIPRDSSETLYKRFGAGVASFAVVSGASHNTISESAEYVLLLKGEQGDDLRTPIDPTD